MSSSPSSPFPLRFPFGKANSTEQFSPEMHGDSVIGPAKLLEDVGLSDAPCLPSAIQMFESRLGPITENQVTLSHRCVPPEVPRLADFEVSAELRGYVRRDWNCHNGIE